MPNINERMIQRIDADPNLTPEQKRELKVRWGWQDTKGSISAEKKPSWYNAGDRLAYEVEKRTNTTGPVSGAIRLIGGFGDWEKGLNKATTVLGPLVHPQLQRTFRKLATELSGNVKESRTTQAKAMIHRLLTEHGQGLSWETRKNIMEDATSDPIANVLIGNDIGERSLTEARGHYTPIFGNSGDPERTVDSFLTIAKNAPDQIPTWLRTFRKQRYGDDLAIALDQRTLREDPESILREALPHEFTHGGHDGVGALSDVALDAPYDEWAHKPIEWEAAYAGSVGDPAKNRFGVTDVLRSGQGWAQGRKAAKYDSGEQFENQLYTINERLRKNNPQQRYLLQPALDTVEGKKPRIDLFDTHNYDQYSIHSPRYRALMNAILGLK